MTPLTLEIVAAIFGVWGTVLLAMKGPRAGWGFVAYLVSNVAWLVFAWANGHWAMFAQTLAFMASSIVGVWIWLLKPALDAVNEVFDL